MRAGWWSTLCRAYNMLLLESMSLNCKFIKATEDSTPRPLWVGIRRLGALIQAYVHNVSKPI